MIRKEQMDQEMMDQVQLFVVGELDDAEHKVVFDWISSSSRNLRYYCGLQATLWAAESYRSEKKYDIERVRSRLDERIKMADKTNKRGFRRLFQVAATLL